MVPCPPFFSLFRLFFAVDSSSGHDGQRSFGIELFVLCFPPSLERQWPFPPMRSDYFTFSFGE